MYHFGFIPDIVDETEVLEERSANYSPWAKSNLTAVSKILGFLEQPIQFFSVLLATAFILQGVD